jgi:hypothetical protein
MTVFRTFCVAPIRGSGYVDFTVGRGKHLSGFRKSGLTNWFAKIFGSNEKKWLTRNKEVGKLVLRSMIGTATGFAPETWLGTAVERQQSGFERPLRPCDEIEVATFSDGAL